MKWFRNLSGTGKGMLIVAALLLIGIIVRWEYVSREAAGAFRGIFTPTEKRTEAPAADDTLRHGTAPDSTALPLPEIDE